MLLDDEKLGDVLLLYSLYYRRSMNVRLRIAVNNGKTSICFVSQDFICMGITNCATFSQSLLDPAHLYTEPTFMIHT